MGIQISLATGCNTQKLGLKGEFSPTSSWTGWRGSSPSRTWRSGLSMRSEFRPLTELALGPGASRSMAGPGSPVRTEICSEVCQTYIIMEVYFKSTKLCPLTAVPSSGPTNVSAFATTSSSILVRWGEVPEADRNGLILGYKVISQLSDYIALKNDLSFRITKICMHDIQNI